MKIFIDTANIEQIKKANDMGLIDGVTTNPSLVSKENKTMAEVIPQICEIVDLSLIHILYISILNKRNRRSIKQKWL